jgi:quercetin dioxygenase-like cupin family protein
VEHTAEGKFLARPLLEGKHSNVRIIRLAEGQALPPHRHGESDLMLYAVEGAGELDTANGVVTFAAGDLAWYSGDEELRVRNSGSTEMTRSTCTTTRTMRSVELCPMACTR